MPEEILDVKPSVEPSATETNVDATNNTAKTTTEATTTTTGAATAPSLEEVLKAHMEKVLSPEPKVEEPVVKVEEAKSEEDEAKAKEEAEKKVKEEQALADEAKKPVPYDRFHEINEAKTKLEQELEGEKPWADAHRSISKFLGDHQVTKEQFQFWIDVMANSNSNPSKALEMLQPVIDQIKDVSGDKLPADLQKLVDDTVIPLDVAKRLAKAEATQKFTDRQVQKTAQQRQQELVKQQTDTYIATMSKAFNEWVGSKTKDADFSPKKNGDSNGKFEMVVSHITALLSSEGTSVKTPEDYKKLCEKAYKDVDATLSRYAPRQKASPTPVVTNRANGSQKKESLTFEEKASEMLVQKHGIKWEPPVRK